ncbi:hypothetical protein [Terrabacter sp. Ter38]|uniref:hypothetical protein n=1 Tax=Terrabacter sp. Ter38 TaxID=2926030 RepID=UPI0021184445|nr:hypothetical protein [Terrabacter sp. Ter38]
MPTKPKADPPDPKPEPAKPDPATAPAPGPAPAPTPAPTPPTSASASGASWRWLFWAAIAIVFAYVVFVLLAFVRADDKLPETDWSRSVYVLLGLEALAFTAVGWLFGREVHRGEARAVLIAAPAPVVAASVAPLTFTGSACKLPASSSDTYKGHVSELAATSAGGADNMVAVITGVTVDGIPGPQGVPRRTTSGSPLDAPDHGRRRRRPELRRLPLPA